MNGNNNASIWHINTSESAAAYLNASRAERNTAEYQERAASRRAFVRLDGKSIADRRADPAEKADIAAKSATRARYLKGELAGRRLEELQDDARATEEARIAKSADAIAEKTRHRATTDEIIAARRGVRAVPRKHSAEAIKAFEDEKKIREAARENFAQGPAIEKRRGSLQGEELAKAERAIAERTAKVVEDQNRRIAQRTAIFILDVKFGERTPAAELPMAA